jgi:hypothetical protein
MSLSLCLYAEEAPLVHFYRRIGGAHMLNSGGIQPYRGGNALSRSPDPHVTLVADRVGSLKACVDLASPPGCWSPGRTRPEADFRQRKGRGFSPPCSWLSPMLIDGRVRSVQMDARRSFCLRPKQDDFELTQIGQPDPVEIAASRVANDNVRARAALSARCGSFLLQLIAKPFAKESDRRN